MQKSIYYSFLFRLWLVEQDNQFTWRASLEDPLTGQDQLFSSLDDLIHFLQNEFTLPIEKDKNKQTSIKI